MTQARAGEGRGRAERGGVALRGPGARVVRRALQDAPGPKVIRITSAAPRGGTRADPTVSIGDARTLSLTPGRGRSVYVVLDAATLTEADRLVVERIIGARSKAREASSGAAPDGASAEERWRALRESFLAEFESVPATELARLTGSQSANPSARAYAWRKAGRVFSVNDGTGERFPLFQLHQGQPRPVVAEVIAALGGRLSPWELALWFATPHPDLGDFRRPVDLLGEVPAEVAVAARASAAAPVY